MTGDPKAAPFLARYLCFNIDPANPPPWLTNDFDDKLKRDCDAHLTCVVDQVERKRYCAGKWYPMEEAG